MRAPGQAGVRWHGRANPFPTVTSNAQGGNQPGITGTPFGSFRPGPGPSSGGQLGAYDGSTGADPRAPQTSPSPHVSALGDGQETFRRYAIQGFNDKLTVKDRHAYWDSGHQRTGTSFDPASGGHNAYNDPLNQTPRPDLRVVNRTVSYQKGSDKTRNQDDLSRPYTWLGTSGEPWSKIYGGVPGLYQPYGSRGGVVSPVPYGSPDDGPRLVSPGPPHGLHSQTPWKGGAQLIRRYMATPQMRPVRLDRPSNSPQAGQSYSQTVRPQGASGVRPSSAAAPRSAGPMQHTGRGWGGRPS